MPLCLECGGGGGGERTAGTAGFKLNQLRAAFPIRKITLDDAGGGAGKSNCKLFYMYIKTKGAPINSGRPKTTKSRQGKTEAETNRYNELDSSL